MKKFFAVVLIFSVLCVPSYSEENYDPQHTMLALNIMEVKERRY